MLITGASEGIGAACVRAFRARGARLALNGRSAEKLARVAGPQDLILAADVTRPDAAQSLIDRTVAHFGRIDIVINNAGHGIYWPIAASPEREIRAMFDLNFFAPLAISQAVIPVMRKHGSGSIVNIGSIAGNVALPWMPLYSTSKSALAALTASLRMELAPDGIHVMLVCPGYVLTRFHENSFGMPPPPKVIAGKRFAITPEQCAHAVVSGLERRARIVVTPRWSWFLIALHHLVPRAVESHLMQLNHSSEAA